MKVSFVSTESWDAYRRSKCRYKEDDWMLVSGVTGRGLDRSYKFGNYHMEIVANQ